MRAELADTALARHAGRFVWLELNFDSPANREFLVRHAIAGTPTLFVLDPVDERATATHLGALALPELVRFLDAGARGVAVRATSPAGSALARGEAELGLGRLDAAIAAYREALRAGGPSWAGRAHALVQLTAALAASSDAEACATLAAREAPGMARSPEFARVASVGLMNAVRGGSAPWAPAARASLVPLAAEATVVPGLDRDTRFELFRALAGEADQRGDRAAVARWGATWQRELDASVPRNDDDRTSLDIARVEASDFVPDPGHFIAALEASERAMPHDYVPSLRLAQLLLDARRWDDTIAACERGLAKVDGPLGRTWLLELKARASLGKGDRDGAVRALEQARQSAAAINMPGNRESNLRTITSLIAQAGGVVK
jgi:tetratricopeptide (TPR) repeat protein